jgi:hypothetical protein
MNPIAQGPPIHGTHPHCGFKAHDAAHASQSNKAAGLTSIITSSCKLAQPINTVIVAKRCHYRHHAPGSDGFCEAALEGRAASIGCGVAETFRATSVKAGMMFLQAQLAATALSRGDCKEYTKPGHPGCLDAGTSMRSLHVDRPEQRSIQVHWN